MRNATFVIGIDRRRSVTFIPQKLPKNWKAGRLVTKLLKLLALPREK
jgi:hypothetical protein